MAISLSGNSSSPTVPWWRKAVSVGALLATVGGTSAVYETIRIPVLRESVALETTKADKERITTLEEKLKIAEKRSDVPPKETPESPGKTRLFDGFDGYRIYTRFDEKSDKKDIAIGLFLSKETKERIKQPGNTPTVIQVIVESKEDNPVSLYLRDTRTPRDEASRPLTLDAGLPLGDNEDKRCYSFTMSQFSTIDPSQITEVRLEQENVANGAQRNFRVESVALNSAISQDCK